MRMLLDTSCVRTLVQRGLIPEGKVWRQQFVVLMVILGLVEGSSLRGLVFRTSYQYHFCSDMIRIPELLQLLPAKTNRELESAFELVAVMTRSESESSCTQEAVVSDQTVDQVGNKG